MRKYEHSKEYIKKFWNNKYAEYKKKVKAIGGVALNKKNFKASYESYVAENEARVKAGKSTRQPMRELVNDSKYSVRYATAVAEHKQLKDLGIKVNFQDLRYLDTHEFAELYGAEISKAYKAAYKLKGNAYEANLLISQQWFGSK